MATRFYLPSVGAAPVTPALGSGWELTTGYTAHPLPTVKSNTPRTAGTARAKGAASASYDRMDRVFVSDPLAAQTISGTFSMVIPAIESNAAHDTFLQVMVRVLSSDGATVKATLYAGSATTSVSATTSAENGEIGTAAATRIKSALALTSYACAAGDRLSVEIGYRSCSTGTTSYTATLTYGDPQPTADYALTAALTTALVPWFELSANLAFSIGDVIVPGPATAAESDVSSTVTIARPQGLANGDVLVFVNTWSYDGADPAAPANGFTLLGADKAQGSDTTSPNVRVSAKPITNISGEPSSYAMSASSSGNNVGILIPLRGLTSLFAELVALDLAGTPTPNSTTHTLPSRTADVVPLLHLMVFTSQYYTTTKNTYWTRPPVAGVVAIGQESSIFNNVLVCAEIDTVAGAIGARTATVSQTQSAGRAASIGLQVASGAAPPADTSAFFHVAA